MTPHTQVIFSIPFGSISQKTLTSEIMFVSLTLSPWPNINFTTQGTSLAYHNLTSLFSVKYVQF